jgi:hypothetical protein
MISSQDEQDVVISFQMSVRIFSPACPPARGRSDQKITSQPEVISSPDKRQNTLLDALYKPICSANKVKMFSLLFLPAVLTPPDWHRAGLRRG